MTFEFCVDILKLPVPIVKYVVVKLVGEGLAEYTKLDSAAVEAISVWLPA